MILRRWRWMRPDDRPSEISKPICRISSVGWSVNHGQSGSSIRTTWKRTSMPDELAQNTSMLMDESSGHSHLLSADRTILERTFMEYRPFGVDERGEKVTDVSGMIVLDNVEFLQESIARTGGE